MRLNNRLRGSTLVETLVMMLVAGILFLAVMDGLTLFSRLQARRAERLLETGRRIDGYYRTVSLITGADSILSGGTGELLLSRRGNLSVLLHTDSVLVYRTDGFRDTLLTGVGALQLFEYENHSDTIELHLSEGFVAKFGVSQPARQYRTERDKLEKGYEYEE